MQLLVQGGSIASISEFINIGLYIIIKVNYKHYINNLCDIPWTLCYIPT